MSLKTYKPKPKYLKLVLKKLKLNHLLLVETHVYSTGFTVPDSKHVLLSQAGRQAGTKELNQVEPAAQSSWGLTASCFLRCVTHLFTDGKLQGSEQLCEGRLPTVTHYLGFA